MTSRLSRPLTVFIAHPSELLTDHLPHGDGLVSFGFVRRLAERGHHVHVAAQRVDIRSPLPPTLHLHVLMPASDKAVLDRLAFMVRMRLLFQRLSRDIDFDLVHQMNPVFTGLSLSLLGVRPPLVLGTFVPRWHSAADGPARRGAWLTAGKQWALDALARLQQSRAAGLLICAPEAISRIADPARHRGPHLRGAARDRPVALPAATGAAAAALGAVPGQRHPPQGHLHAARGVRARRPRGARRRAGDRRRRRRHGGRAGAGGGDARAARPRPGARRSGRRPGADARALHLLPAVLRRAVRHQHPRGDGLRRAGGGDPRRRRAAPDLRRRRPAGAAARPGGAVRGADRDPALAWPAAGDGAAQPRPGRARFRGRDGRGPPRGGLRRGAGVGRTAPGTDRVAARARLLVGSGVPASGQREPVS